MHLLAPLLALLSALALPTLATTGPPICITLTGYSNTDCALRYGGEQHQLGSPHTLCNANPTPKPPGFWHINGLTDKPPPPPNKCQNFDDAPLTSFYYEWRAARAPVGQSGRAAGSHCVVTSYYQPGCPQGEGEHKHVGDAVEGSGLCHKPRFSGMGVGSVGVSCEGDEL
ncbi:hypothetical protein LTR36_009854 [Oleoguttula mirabilis]|uniref:Uncharacterized protein n=1 Tax=Oleoguttula mirabilis TaxID=1507867 RepID=A0AAV9J5K5_9PEZI|nr:hypothetical protein LTR36_009854 [Oleoguttula mirabilis]